MLDDAKFWILLSFLIFAYGFYRYGWPVVLGMLDGRIERIRKELNEAEALRVEAQELLVQYQRKHRDAMKEAAEITARAQEQADAMRRQMEADLAALMSRREQQLADRLARLEKEAQAEIQAAAARLALEAAQAMIKQSLDQQAQSSLIDKTLAHLPSALQVGKAATQGNGHA